MANGRQQGEDRLCPLVGRHRVSRNVRWVLGRLRISFLARGWRIGRRSGRGREERLPLRETVESGATLTVSVYLAQPKDEA